MVVKREVPRRSHVYFVNFSPTKGHEQRGVRPAVVVTSDEYNLRAGMAVVCPLTSERKGYPFEVVCDVEGIRGVILVDQVCALDWQARRFQEHSALPENVFAEVQAKLHALFR